MYRTIINKNKHRFAVGKTFKRKSFCRMFRIKGVVHQGTFHQIQRSNLELVSVQTKINKILMEQGLVLKSRNYYSEFYIADKASTKSKIVKHSEQAEDHKFLSDGLEKNMTYRIKAGTWGNYSNTVVPPITASSHPGYSKTHENKIKRIKRL